jgi:hypothetical protein
LSARAIQKEQLAALAVALASSTFLMIFIIYAILCYIYLYVNQVAIPFRAGKIQAAHNWPQNIRKQAVAKPHSVTTGETAVCTVLAVSSTHHVHQLNASQRI